MYTSPEYKAKTLTCLIVKFLKRKHRRKSLWYTIESYSAMKRKDLLVYATIWMNLKIFMFNERSQTKQKSGLYAAVILNFRKCRLIYSDREKISSRLWRTAMCGRIHRSMRKLRI